MNTNDPTRTAPKPAGSPASLIQTEHSEKTAETPTPESLAESQPGAKDEFSLKILNKVLKTIEQMLARPEGEGPKEITLFEKVFLARFQDQAPLGEELPKGEARFLAKPEGKWVEFFQKFLPFTVERRGRATDLEALVYRGLLKGASEAQVVSDLRFVSGKTEKFARLGVPDTVVMDSLAQLTPGDRMAPETLVGIAKPGEGEGEFAYLAISHRIENPSAAKLASNPATESNRQAGLDYQGLEGGRFRETQGIALSARTEQLMAERLAIHPRGVPTGPRMGRKRAGSSEGDFAEGGTVFVPWFERALGFKKHSGKPRWWVPLLYFGLIASLVFIAFAVVRMLQD